MGAAPGGFHVKGARTAERSAISRNRLTVCGGQSLQRQEGPQMSKHQTQKLENIVITVRGAGGGEVVKEPRPGVCRCLRQGGVVVQSLRHERQVPVGIRA